MKTSTELHLKDDINSVMDKPPLIKEMYSDKRKLVILSASFILVFISTGFGYSLNVLFAELVREFDTERSNAALVQSIYLSLVVGGAVIWNYPVSKFGLTKCIISGSIIFFIGTFASAFSFNIWMVIFLLGLMAGLGNSIVAVGPFMVVGEVIEERKTAALAFIAAAASLGSFAFTFIMEKLIQHFYWNGALLFFSGIGLHIIPCGLILHFAKQSSRSVANKEVNVTKLFKVSLLKDWKVVVMLINSLIFSFTFLTETLFFVDLIMLKGFTRETGSTFASFVNIANLCGRIIGVGIKMFIRNYSILQMAILMIFFGATHAILLFMEDYYGLLTGGILNGFIFGLCAVQFPTLMLDVVPIADFAPAYSMWSIMGGVGLFTGGYIGGSIEDTTGSYDVLLVSSILLNIVNAICFFVVAISACFKHKSSHTECYERLE